MNELQNTFGSVRRTRSTVTFTGPFKDTKNAAMVNLIPAESSPEQGLCWQIYDLRFSEYLGITKQEVSEIIPARREPWKYGTPGDQKSYAERNIVEAWSGYRGYINMDEARRFIEEVNRIKVQIS